MKRLFKKLVVPSIYVVTLLVFSASLYLIESLINTKQFKANDDIQYVDKEIITDYEYVPVVIQVATIVKPYNNEAVYVSKKFYDSSSTENQEDAIILYGDTYIQNTGIDYRYSELFDVVSILDGVVIEVSDNELLGKTIKIQHVNNLVSVYQSLNNVTLKENDTVLRGQIIGSSGNSVLYDKEYNLHFELYKQGEVVNPELYYNKSQDDL